MKLSTPIQCPPLPVRVGLEDRVMVLGSCFADRIGARLSAAGFELCVNPFGTLYNPASVAQALERLSNPRPFTEADCVEMGAGAALVCSWSHHTGFARPDTAAFLENANRSLADAAAFWQRCNKMIITLGTAFVWRLRDSGAIVSNCLKRPAAEFTHERLGEEEVLACLQRICPPDSGRSYIFTVSPIRHLGDGAHANQLSKATLLLALDRFLAERSDAAYFPAYEILLDELRDYRFYAEDLLHPSETAVSWIWEAFLQAAVPESDLGRIAENEKAARRSAHRPIHSL